MGSNIFPDVLLNDIAGPDGNSLLLSLKLAVDVLVSMKRLTDILHNNPIILRSSCRFYFFFSSLDQHLILNIPFFIVKAPM